MAVRAVRFAALAVIFVAVMAGPALPSAPATHPAAPPVGAPHLAFHPPPALRPIGRPASSEYWYTQVGATLSEVNGTTLSGQLTSLVEDVTLVSSSYPIGYELNGISTTGDWYQVLISDNWGGCNAGFEMTYEVWNNTGYGATPVCDPTLTLNAGDSVKLSLSFPSSTQACLDAEDLTTTSQEHDCVGQPDTGATGFEPLGSASNANGYLTGPMTEIANPGPTSCPDYTNMPVVDYRWPAAYHVMGYYPFSDEFEVLGGSIVALCYSSDESEAVLATGDPTSQVVDTASGTSYGPHYVSGQNFSYFVASDGWRLVTDPVPLTGVTVAPTSGTFTLGTVLELNATVSGGTSPYSALWSVNGTFEATLGIHYNWTASASGSFGISAYGMDHQDLVDGPATAIIDVPGALSAGAVTASTTSDGADVGQTITISSRVVGGLPPYQYIWAGLPPGCSAADVGSISCAPTSIGTYPVELRVIDTNGTQVTAPTLSLIVSPAFSASVSTSQVAVDVGQTFWVNVSSSGGAAPVRYIWGNVPAGCVVPAGPSTACSPIDPGRASFAVTATDDNGVEVNLTPGSVVVSADPTVQVTSSRTTADAGVPIVLSVAVQEGAFPYQYHWAGLATGCAPALSGTSATCAFAPGTTEIWVNVTDANGLTVNSTPERLGIFPALVATVAGSGNVTLGNTVHLNVTSNGGAGSVSYTWENLPSGCSPPSSGDLACVPATVGEYNVTVILADAGGGRVTLVASFNVTAAAGPTGSAGIGTFEIVLIGVAVAAIVAAAAVLISRRPRE